MPTRRYFANFAPVQTLSVGISSSATSVTVPSFTGWPVTYPFFATIDYGTSSAEIVNVTNIAGSVATIQRGQGGTTAVAHVAGATIDMTAVAQDLDEANAHTSANSGVHGVAGNVVGTTDVQTLTNKTFTGTTTMATVNATSIAATGASTAASYTANTNGVVAGVIRPKTYTDETAAVPAQTTSNIVYLSAPTTAGHSAGLYAWIGGAWQPVVVDSGWTALTLQNSWVSFDGGTLWETPTYRLLNGIVYLKGMMKNGLSGAGTVAFTLPTGYRPLHRRKFLCASPGGSVEVNIYPDGTATLFSASFTGTASNAYIALDTVIFPAEQ